MKTIHSLFLFTLIFAVVACKKEEPSPIEPVRPAEPPIYVPIFEPGDTSKGVAYANKLTAFWRSGIYCKTAYLDSTKLEIVAYTFTKDGSIREILGLGAVPKQNGLGKYAFHPDIYTPPPAGKVGAFYGTMSSDGDVTEDFYLLDATDIKNNLNITKIDLPNKRVEGTFHVSYNLREPRLNPQNPKKVTFSEGRFWAAIRD